MKWNPFRKKQVQKKLGGIRQRNYDAAKTSDPYGSWGLGGESANQLIWKSLDKIRSRSRDVMRNDSYAKKFKRMVISNVVGPNGVRLQNKAKDNNGKLDQVANDAIEKAWKKFTKSCDVTGTLTFIQLCDLVIGNTVADGEVLIRKVKGRGTFGLELQLIEADHLPTIFNDANRNIKSGIQYDSYGKPIFYHLYKHHPSSGTMLTRGELVQIPADEIIHVYMPDRIGQGRGIPWMHAALNNLKMLNGYLEAELVAARISAAKSGFYTKPEEDVYVGDGTDENGDPVQEVTPGMIETLPPGWDFKSFDPTHSTSAFKDFAKAVLRGVSSGFDVNYNSLANDLEGVNFSSIRAGVLDERDTWMMLQQWFIDTFVTDVYEEWLRMSLLTQKVNLPLQKFDKFNSPHWMARRWAWVDPQKDMTANILAMKAGLKAPSMIASDMGYDIDEIYLAIKRDEEAREKIGITTASDAELLQLLAEINKTEKENA